MRVGTLGAVLVLAAAAAGCSVRRIAVNKLASALASSGTTFEGDDDPELVAGALPFALKLMESLLAESPRHAGLLLAAASGFTEYSYAFVGEPADRAFNENLARSAAGRERARRLYLRARGYGMRALEVRYPGFGRALEEDRDAALSRVRKRDVPLLYWTAAAHGLAISAAKDDPEMIAQLPVVEAFLARAAALDAGWHGGALAEFLLSLEAARADSRSRESKARMDRHFAGALAASGGRRASLFVSYAENACLPAQDRTRFREMLERALAIDPDRHPETRLATLIAQRRARWLLGRVDELFLEASKED